MAGDSRAGASQTPARAEAGDPVAIPESVLRSILSEVASAPAWRPETLDTILRRHPKTRRGFYSKTELLAGYRALAPGSTGLLDERRLLDRLRRKPIRTASGVAPLTVLTRPHPCPGRCIFCPNDVRMPKSYIASEPGAQRAESHRFDPYRQTWSRLHAFRQMGHDVDKVELIVLGGTWSHYPEAYQVWFVERCLAAMSDFGAGIDARGEHTPTLPEFRDARLEPDRGDGGRRYNRSVSALLAQGAPTTLRRPDARAAWRALETAQHRNEAAAVRVVGLVVETRPDAVDEAEVHRLRRLGVTKVQLGIQSLSDRVLRLNRRGHDVDASRRAARRLRRAGFKLHLHWMPNLLGATPESDRDDFDLLCTDPALRPDELKIYPCSLIADTELVDHHRTGRWQPYAPERLARLLADCLERAPRTMRLTRVIRDIPSNEILAGNRFTNLREVAERELAARGGRAVEIRAREIRRAPVEPSALLLRASRHATDVGEEWFLELVDRHDRLAGFLRLLLPAGPPPFAELESAALVRELHVYGPALALGERRDGSAQHRGAGPPQVAAAVERAAAAGYARRSGVSASGPRPYYRRLGFEDGRLYQHRSLAATQAAQQ